MRRSDLDEAEITNFPGANRPPYRSSSTVGSARLARPPAPRCLRLAACRQPKFALIQARMAAHSGDCWM